MADDTINRADFDADLALSLTGTTPSDRYPDTVLSFHGLKGGKVWLFSVAQLTARGFAFLLRDGAPSYLITPDLRFFIIDRQHPDGAGGGSGLWKVQFTYSAEGRAQLEQPVAAPVSSNLLSESLYDVMRPRKLAALNASAVPSTDGASSIDPRSSTAAAPINRRSNQPIPGRYGYARLGLFSQIVGHMKGGKLFALGQTDAPGLPRELYGMSHRRCEIYGCKCWACEARRNEVTHVAPMIERPLPRLQVIGDTVHTDFTRDFVPDIAEGYTLAVLFTEACTTRVFAYGLHCHDDFFAAAQHLIDRIWREHHVRLRIMFTDADTTWFVPGRMDPYTARVTALMDSNKGLTVTMAAPKKQARSLMENRSGPLYSTMYSQVIAAHLSKKFWWLSLDTATGILGALPVVETTKSALLVGHTPNRAYFGVWDDYSTFHSFGAMAKAKVHGNKTSSLNRQSDVCLYIRNSHISVGAYLLRIRDQKLVLTDDYRVDDNLGHRPAMLAQVSGLLNNTDVATSTSTDVPVSDYNANIISLFNAAERTITMENGVLEYWKTSAAPIRLIRMFDPYEEENYMVPEDELEGDALQAPPTAAIAPLPEAEHDPSARAAADRLAIQQASLLRPDGVPLPLGAPRDLDKQELDSIQLPFHDSLALGHRIARLPDAIRINMRGPPCPVVGKRAATYKKYMTSTTLGEYRRFGGTQDIKLDIASGFLTFVNPMIAPLLGVGHGTMLSTRARDLFPPRGPVTDIDHRRVHFEPLIGDGYDAVLATRARDLFPPRDPVIVDYDAPPAARLLALVLEPALRLPLEPERPEPLSIGSGGGGACATAYSSFMTQRTTSPWPVNPHDDITETDDASHALYVASFECMVTETNNITATPPDAQAHLAAHVAQAPPVPEASHNGAGDAQEHWFDNISEPTNELSEQEIEQIAEEMVQQILGDDHADEDVEMMVMAVTKAIDSRLKPLGPDEPMTDDLTPYVTYAVGTIDISDSPPSPEESIPDPLTLKEMLAHKHKKEFLEATLAEWINLNTRFKCFKPVPLSEALRRRRNGEIIHIVPTKWVWTKKPTRWKSRLVACQCVGQYYIPFEQKWSPTLCMDSMRLIYTIGVKYGCEFVSLDIAQAYLFGERPAGEPDIYLRLPPGLEHLAEYMKSKGLDPDPMLQYKTADGKPMCWFLDGNLYGTITAGRTFFLYIHNWLVNEMGFTSATPDPCIFIIRNEHGFLIIGVYVDDLLLAPSSPAMKEWFFAAFEKKFVQSPDSGDQVYLGLEFESSPDLKSVSLNCPKLWRKLRGSLNPSVKLPKVIQPVPANVLDLIYEEVSTSNPLVPESVCHVRQLLGLLAWGVSACRPAESFSSAVLARRAHIPTLKFVHVLYGFISYLLDHEHDQLYITDDGEPMFTSSVDSSFGNCPATHRSWFGYALSWGGATFSWRVGVLPLVLPSTRDSEAAAIVYAIKGMLASFILITELGFAPDGVTPLPLGTDSAAALANSMSDYIHRDSRWTSMRLGFVRDLVKATLIKLYKIHTDVMPADCLTKAPKSGVGHERARARHMGKPPS